MSQITGALLWLKKWSYLLDCLTHFRTKQQIDLLIDGLAYLDSLNLLCFSIVTNKTLGTLSMKVTLSNLFFLPSKKRSTPKEKNLLPVGENSFLLDKTHFWKDLDIQKSKQEVLKRVILVKIGRKICLLYPLPFEASV